MNTLPPLDGYGVHPGPNAHSKLAGLLKKMSCKVSTHLVNPDLEHRIWQAVRLKLMMEVEAPATAAVRAAPFGAHEPEELVI